MNNWAILFFMSAFLKCLERRFLLARWRVINSIYFWVVHKVLIFRLTFVNSSDLRIVS